MALPFCFAILKYIYIIDNMRPRWYNSANPIESGRETDLMTPQQPKNFQLGAKFRVLALIAATTYSCPSNEDERWDGEGRFCVLF